MLFRAISLILMLLFRAQRVNTVEKTCHYRRNCSDAEKKNIEELVSWKNISKDATALMIDGERRVGKSFIAE